MAYFSSDFIKFFKSLEKNNTTEWFNENRKTYEQAVKKPFQVFVDDMISRIKKHDPAVNIKAGDAIMRINKDIRFSKDKTPYNTHVAANISPFGKKDKSYPGFYFQLSPKGIQLFGGVYMAEPPRLEKIRTYMGKHLKEFSAAIGDKKFKDMYGKLKGEQSKRLTPELQKLQAREPLIANKQFYFSTELSADHITSAKLADTLMAHYTAARPVNSFFTAAWEKK
jgi:uncharacterized protein (TIGR02453 family)